MKKILIPVFIISILSFYCSAQDVDALIKQQKFNEVEQLILSSNEVDRKIYMTKLADAYFEMNKLYDAAQYYIELNDKKRLEKLAKAYFQENEHYKALKYYMMSGDSISGYKHLASYYLEQSKADSAKKYIILYEEQLPSRNHAYHGLVQKLLLLYLADEKYYIAADFAKEYAYVPNKGLLAVKLLEKGYPILAYDFRQFTQNKNEFNNTLGQVLMEKGEYKMAAQCFVSSGNGTKEHECYSKMGEKLVEKGDIKEAIRFFDKANTETKGNNLIGDYYYEKGMYEKANFYYIKLPPDRKYHPIFNKMIDHVLKVFNFSSAVTYYKKLGLTEKAKVIEKEPFKDNNNGTVSSTRYPIMWQKALLAPKDWKSASTYCKELVLGGFDDWLLPSSMAFNVTLLKFAGAKEDYLESLFPGLLNRTFWTKTTYSENDNKIYVITIMENGEPALKEKSNTFHVKCYRNQLTNE